MNFESYLKTSAKEINQELENTLKKWNEEVQRISPKLKRLNNSFIQACQGGKRLRGTLVKLGFELAKIQNYGKEILKPAVAFEIFQTSILAHDDIIDKSDLRRGQPTIWKNLGGNHYGISQTICLGDIGFFLAFKILSESNFSDYEKNKAIQYFSKAMLDTGIGQMLDVALSYTYPSSHISSGKVNLEDEVLSIFRLKTAHYTLVGPLRLGAILAGADSKLLRMLEEFGEKLGIAFQIQDDILGVFGDEKTLGKSVTSDIEEGKITLLYLYALKNGGKEGLDGCYGEKRGLEGLEKVRKIFRETGALNYSKKKAVTLVKEAKRVIPQITDSLEFRIMLEEMADFLVKREK